MEYYEVENKKLSEKLIRSFEENIKCASQYAKIAVDDIGKWKDKDECLRSLCYAYKYAGKAELCASILLQDFGMETYRARTRVVSKELNDAMEKIIETRG